MKLLPHKAPLFGWLASWFRLPSSHWPDLSALPVPPHQQSMRGLEPFILGMLTNFDALPLDRIHNMLKVRQQRWCVI